MHVDDIVVIGNFKEEILGLKETVAREFEINDLGNLKYFLGLEVARSKKGNTVFQQKYVLDLLFDTGMTSCKPADTPIDPK